ncbi:MAG: hypothetical protein GY923_15465 [Aestuariibacter sp.]|nr:hypothetical protein [Aestuariibacter sp.]
MAGTQVYTLTAKPKQINRIWYLDTSGSTDRTELRMAGVEEFGIDANYLAVGATAPGQKLRWRWMNYKLYVWPLPSGSGYLEVWYTPKYTALTGDFPDYYPESIRDWIIYDVTAMFLGRVETDNSYWVGKAQQARRDFVNDLANPVRAAPNKIRRVYPKVM